MDRSGESPPAMIVLVPGHNRIRIRFLVSGRKESPDIILVYRHRTGELALIGALILGLSIIPLKGFSKGLTTLLPSL